MIMGVRGNHGHTKGYPAWNKGMTKETNESIRKQLLTLKLKYESGELTGSMTGKHHTEETKKKLSEARKKWLSEHKDLHVWKRNTKFMSKPCEELKKYLREHNISFVEEYEPFDEVNYSIDIAWPDEKIAIEVNGNLHYNSDGSLKEYYLKRHNMLSDNGWIVFEIHYSKCYNININDFEDILKLPIYDKDYVGKYLSKKEHKKQEKELKRLKKEEDKRNNEEFQRAVINDLIDNSNIDFSKTGWSGKAKEYLESKGSLFNKCIFKVIRKYRPDFLKREDVKKRKGSIY